MESQPLKQFEFSTQLVKKSQAVCRVFGFNAENNSDGIGTGFAISGGNHLITAEHVVAHSNDAVVAASGPRAWVSTAKVIARSIEEDTAILELAQIAPAFLRLSGIAKGGEVGPLICWEDAATGPTDAIASKLELKEVPALWISQIEMSSGSNQARIILSGGFRKGMSGGPVYSPKLDAVVAVVSALPPLDPYSVVDAWREHSRTDEGYSRELGSDVATIIEEVLAKGIGLAVPADVLLKILSENQIDLN